MHDLLGAPLAACLAAAVFACALVSPSAVATRTADATRCNPCAVGQALSWHGTSYRVSSVRTASRIGDGPLDEPANGVFVILTITMTNLKATPSTVIAGALQVRTRTNDVYSTLARAFGAYSNAFQPLETLRPRVPTTVTAVYELPKEAVQGARLEIRDIGTGTTAAINLGL